MGKTPLYRILYKFYFSDKRTKLFEILLDPDTITLVLPKKTVTPGWTKLLYHQCTCCTLDPCQHPYCPIAVNIAEVVREFEFIVSSDSCIVRCMTPERTYEKNTLVQDGLFSILGIIMATSNCPIMNFFKPMARFHLPFSTIQETIFRSTSIYLFRQYFEYKKGKAPDLELKQLDQHYKKVQAINHGILDRIGNVSQKDSDKNAIVILNVLAQMLSMEIDEELNSFEYLFEQ